MLRYRIKYTWPDGKVRYRVENRLTIEPEDASIYTLIEASDIIKNKSRDAKLVWGIVTIKERVRDPILWSALLGADSVCSSCCPPTSPALVSSTKTQVC